MRIIFFQKCNPLVYPNKYPIGSQILKFLLVQKRKCHTTCFYFDRNIKIHVVKLTVVSFGACKTFAQTFQQIIYVFVITAAIQSHCRGRGCIEGHCSLINVLPLIVFAIYINNTMRINPGASSSIDYFLYILPFTNISFSSLTLSHRHQHSHA